MKSSGNTVINILYVLYMNKTCILYEQNTQGTQSILNFVLGLKFDFQKRLMGGGGGSARDAPSSTLQHTSAYVSIRQHTPAYVGGGGSAREVARWSETPKNKSVCV